MQYSKTYKESYTLPRGECGKEQLEEELSHDARVRVASRARGRAAWDAKLTGSRWRGKSAISLVASCARHRALARGLLGTGLARGPTSVAELEPHPRVTRAGALITPHAPRAGLRRRRHVRHADRRRSMFALQSGTPRALGGGRLPRRGNHRQWNARRGTHPRRDSHLRSGTSARHRGRGARHRGQNPRHRGQRGQIARHRGQGARRTLTGRQGRARSWCRVQGNTRRGSRGRRSRTLA